MPSTKQPTELSSNTIVVNNIHDKGLLLNTLDQYGVAIVPLNNITTQERNEILEKTQFYKTANNIFKKEYQVEEPTMDEKLNPYNYKKRCAGDDNAGFIHEYSTPLHHMVQSNSMVRTTLSNLYDMNEHDMKFAPNRIRICRKFKNVANSLHIEGHDIFRLNTTTNKHEIIPGEIATIVGISGIRRFVFWDMNDCDLKPLHDYWCDYGSKNFTLIDPKFMNTHYSGRRRMVNIDCRETPHLIVWRETTPHEIAHSPSVSVFISPIEAYNTKKVKYTTSYQPSIYKGLTYHETDLLGFCYRMGGFEWPSGKKLYQFCHSRAYTFYIDKVRDEYKTKTGKFRMKMVDCGKVDQHSDEYKAKLKERNIIIPEIAFHPNTPKFVQDPLELSDRILRDYGFIQ
jgi:hypothetical protein